MWENGLLVESDVLVEDVLDEFDFTLIDVWLNEKDFDGETFSYVITHILDRFPKTWEVLKFQVKTEHKTWTLEAKVLEVVDKSKIWKVEVRFLEEEVESEKHKGKEA
jgi:hypothetical protein